MDTTLYVKDCGKGIPLVMLHGNGESGDYFKNQTAFFSNRYRVIVPDTRGHGKSGRGSRPLCFKTFSDDLLFILDNAGIEKAHLLGFSDGANTAITFAHKKWYTVRKHVCLECGKEYYTICNFRKYCSDACCAQAERKRTEERKLAHHSEHICKVCGKSFSSKRTDAQYCSNGCRQKSYRAERK